MTESLPSLTPPANKFLWAVKTFLDLISRSDNLVYGQGLKRLYVMTSGLDTLNETDIEAMTQKAEQLKLIPESLGGFMITSILKNIDLYGRELQCLIQSRVISIANGDLVNHDLKRPNYYTVPGSFLVRAQKALIDDYGYDSWAGRQPIVTTIQDVANDADHILARMEASNGFLTPQETSWGSVITLVDRLVGLLEQEAKYPVPDRDYKRRARGALKILWFIAKLIMGDLTIKPLAKDLNLVNLSKTISFTDGTLAAIPFPLPETVSVFSDEDGRGMTLKGNLYLSAVSAAAFYRGEDPTL